MAEIPASALERVLIPLLDDDARDALEPFVQNLLEGRATIGDALEGLESDGVVSPISIKPRYSHINLV